MCLMTKVDDYRKLLATLDSWDSFLLSESGLPGPRGNIELAQAVAEVGDEALFLRYLSYDAQRAPTNTPFEFLAFCGVVGMGRLLAEGKHETLPIIRLAANDPRWRMREGTAMALQRWGRVDMNALLQEMSLWSNGSLLEKRAAAAAICEPDLLRGESLAEPVFRILDTLTGSLKTTDGRGNEDYKALRQGLGYCWSVATAAFPEAGKIRMEMWFNDADKDILWVMRENLKKKRLERMDPAWVGAARRRLHPEN
jgi:hypothetical protein